MFPNLNAPAIGVHASLPETIALAQAYGFEGIDFSISEVAGLADSYGLGYVQDLFAAADIRPGAWDFPVNFRQDQATWQRGLEALPGLAGVAKKLDCDRTATWIMPCSDELEFNQNLKFHVDRLRPAAEILADHGCRLGLEFVGPETLRNSQRYPFIYTLAGMIELGQAIDTGDVGLLLDSFHLYTSRGSIDEVRQLNNCDVVAVHVNDAPTEVPLDEQLDNVRTLPGETGIIEIVDFLEALQAIGYDGPVTAEPFSHRLQALSPADAVSETGLAMRRVWQSAGL
jgi:sugar phosphate isomerase/epimerase